MAKHELALLSDFDRFFDRRFFGSGTHWPAFRSMMPKETAGWVPEIDVFEHGNSIVTKIDLPGMKKEDVKVEVTDGHLAISGERASETEGTRGTVYRAERSYGGFYRSLPLPEGVKVEDVKATFTNGVLEVAIPLPAKVEGNPMQVPIREATT
jgi:HSP20 family protein